MDSSGTDKVDEIAIAETPDDVAVLYSWANLHGAKYRDFSASRREYRAQLRQRAAEQVREQALLAQADAEAAAGVAETAARKAADAALRGYAKESGVSIERSLREAEEAAHTATAERVEAARRAEAAAVAEAAARREEREIAEAHASAQRQAARYVDSEVRRRAAAESKPEAVEVPGRMIDPYTIYSNARPAGPAVASKLIQTEMEPPPTMTNRTPQDSALASRKGVDDHQSADTSAPVESERRAYAAPPAMPPRRPQGYRPDDASGVRQIYRGPDHDAIPVEYTSGEGVRHSAQGQARPAAVAGASQEGRATDDAQARQAMRSADASRSPYYANQNASQGERAIQNTGQRRTDLPAAASARLPQTEATGEIGGEARSVWSANVEDRSDLGTGSLGTARSGFSMDALSAGASGRPAPGPAPGRPGMNGRPAAVSSGDPRPVTPFSQALTPPDSTRGRRAQDDFDYQKPEAPVLSSGAASTPSAASLSAAKPMPGAAASMPGVPAMPAPSTLPLAPRRGQPEQPQEPAAAANQPPTYASDQAGPAWLYAPPAAQAPQKPLAPAAPVPAQSSVADTLQHSRERVAARWYALKGVFEYPGQDAEPAPVRQKETRTPVLAVFSLAGGVGKTSLVATVGRALSSMGEKVLLTDTTSHGLLPFYFGASELRQGTVRTFSPPSGSTDAPIYLVSYDVDQRPGDDEAQELLAEQIINNSRGTHRILLDLTVSSSWIVRRMSRMSPTILVPVAPDMNSVISLQTVEKFFAGVNDGDGRPLQPFYVLNQFDASLPLHLDVREVMRRQLGDRLLPFVIRRAPAVSEALAEGMTVVDYAPDAPVAEDYLNLATWLRTIAAPATAGFRNVRWSER